MLFSPPNPYYLVIVLWLHNGKLRVHQCLLYDLRYNIRDLFEIYRAESDSAKVNELVTAGWKNLEVMKNLARVDRRTLREIFRP